MGRCNQDWRRKPTRPRRFRCSHKCLHSCRHRSDRGRKGCRRMKVNSNHLRSRSGWKCSNSRHTHRRRIRTGLCYRYRSHSRRSFHRSRHSCPGRIRGRSLACRNRVHRHSAGRSRKIRTRHRNPLSRINFPGNPADRYILHRYTIRSSNNCRIHARSHPGHTRGRSTADRSKFPIGRRRPGLRRSKSRRIR